MNPTPLTYHIMEFIAALRAAGVRISIAESEDACQAVAEVGLLKQRLFQDTLRTTLIKKASDEPIFEQIFSNYFQPAPPQPVKLLERLTPQERHQLKQAVQGLLGQMRQQTNERMQLGLLQDGLDVQSEDIAQVWSWLLEGALPDETQLTKLEQEIRQEVGQTASAERIERLTHTRLGQQQIPKMQAQLTHRLQQQGLTAAQIEQIMADLTANLNTITEQASRQQTERASQTWANQQANQLYQANQLLQRELNNLKASEIAMLRRQLRRLVAQLRSKLALRQKRIKRNKLDVRRTLRYNMRYGGVPIQLHYKSKPRQPRFLLLCDISHSMRHVVEFALRLIYELQDMVGAVRAFTYIDTIAEISPIFAQSPPDEAMAQAATRLKPHHINTDLGRCLSLLLTQYPDSVNQQTTVIIVGDACNSWNDPQVDHMADLYQRSKALIWLNPRPPDQWETQDCDMVHYLPYATAVHPVSTLAELALAVDSLY